MDLPIVKAVKRPAVLAGQTNGKLPASLLTSITMPGGGTAVVLGAVAVKWRALLAAASAAGFRFSQVGDYRPYADQERIFRARYQTTPIKGAEVKTWQGVKWYKRPGVATAATPGTSNHGWGLALDLAMAGGGSLTDAAVEWLSAHAAEYGISAEIQSEDWHWRPYDGDAMTPAVVRFAALSTQEEDMGLVVEDAEHEGTFYVLGPDGVARRIAGDIATFGWVASGRWSDKGGNPSDFGQPYANKRTNAEPWLDIPKLPVSALAVESGPVASVTIGPEITALTTALAPLVDLAMKLA